MVSFTTLSRITRSACAQRSESRRGLGMEVASSRIGAKRQCDPCQVVRKRGAEIIVVAGRETAISNPDKLLFPKPKHTKLDLARYYIAIESVTALDDGVAIGPGRSTHPNRALKSRAQRQSSRNTTLDHAPMDGPDRPPSRCAWH